MQVGNSAGCPASTQALQEIEVNLREEQRIACEEQLIAFKQARPCVTLNPDPHGDHGSQDSMLAPDVQQLYSFKRACLT
jgi:hypothetical protein